MNTVSQWLHELSKQLTQMRWKIIWRKVFSMAYRVLLSGSAIGFAFVAFLVLACVGLPEFGAFSAALTLWLALEYLYKDALFVFVGSVYLVLVGAATSAAVAVHLPTDVIMPAVIQATSLHMLGLLVAIWLCRSLARWYVRAFVYAYTQSFKRLAVWINKVMADGKKQQSQA